VSLLPAALADSSITIDEHDSVKAKKDKTNALKSLIE
jgi:hypothetical protein